MLSLLKRHHKIFLCLAALSAADEIFQGFKSGRPSSEAKAGDCCNRALRVIENLANTALR